ncbi:hypothetical protein CYMTET_41953 [Cymbomonas tetramitiformis]|uniref:Uncharacterized protein n=1 Tax=Cymbomonas tetramitiformis TaxID=36881 RepID=A0AAE0C6S2_9CHLO|nr:hypothetical protein CYMTET_41953 [Cymbomonas tetramitiformis]
MMQQQQHQDCHHHHHQQQQQKKNLLITTSGQIAILSVEVAASMISKVADPDAGVSAKKKAGANAEIERRMLSSYVLFDNKNPFPPRPANLDSKLLRMYPLYVDKTYDSLTKKSASSMKYEYSILTPALAFLHDILTYAEDTVDGASIDAEGASKSDTDFMRAKVKFLEGCVHQGTEDLVTDDLLKEYLDDFDKSKNKAVLHPPVKQAA